MDVNVGIDVAEDGSGTITVAVGVDDDLLSKVPGAEERVHLDDLTAAGWEVSGPTKESDGNTWVRMSRPFANPAEMSEILAEINGPGGPLGPFTLTITDEWDQTTWELSGSAGLTGGIASFVDQDLAAAFGTSKPLEQLVEESGVPVEQALNLTVTVTLPHEQEPLVVRVPLDGREVPIHAETSDVDQTARWAAIVAGVCGALLAGWLAYRARGRSCASAGGGTPSPADDGPETPPKPRVRTVRLVSYRARLRVELPDRPGALSRVAGIIGECGGNVVSVDVQEVEGSVAVDELVVDLPDDVDGDMLRERLDEDRAGILLSIHGARPYSDMVLRAMQWTEALLESRQSERSDMLASALADLCSASGAWVADSVGEARQFEAGRFALERGAPIAHRTDTIPVGVAPDLTEGAWLLAVPDHESEPLRVAFLARPLRLRFTATEIARVVALLHTCRTLDLQRDEPAYGFLTEV